MLKSLYSGISGLKVNQQKLDVVGNNIANVGTTAFKGSRARFQDMLSQSVSGAQGSSPNQGGMNGSQIGLGVKLAGIDVNQTQGSMTPTNSVTDLAIDGTGYFMVANGLQTATATVDPATHLITAAATNPQISYTRDGSFNRDSQGNFVTSDGYRVLGYAIGGGGAAGKSIGATPGKAIFVDAKGVKADGTADPLKADDTKLMALIIPKTVTKGTPAVELDVTKVTIDNQGLIVATLSDSSQSALGQVAMASFTNTAGLKDLGRNLLQDTTNSGSPCVKTGINTATPANDNSLGYGATNSGFLEASNVDLTEQFTDMIVTTRAFEASGKLITNGDEILQTIIGLKR